MVPYWTLEVHTPSEFPLINMIPLSRSQTFSSLSQDSRLATSKASLCKNDLSVAEAEARAAITRMDTDREQLEVCERERLARIAKGNGKGKREEM